ncbi:hypothetical protein [Mycobacteroides chelonae]|jgi:hypothetical protein|uniref:Uncharacterized protein n=1 Tax=Mycobacteroides chelonae TaxID=1774 RepID=A0AB73MUS2_MYCCH|nr:hypothetical protein [Mycobacteroides chelonae]MBF9326116.1 hypothetical protein [Mycobacteroides chelonae]MBF9420292.1 hypothetical protein [Mycobacteroides chelonae]MBF9439049.1 hypothetical protein [Mycobacteroides chelonae]MBV6360069.1 hypothetical protein [Mycobacteroides chelonae]MEC4834321.1 hypothetical protein [Mycobacteroides chelonae]
MKPTTAAKKLDVYLQATLQIDQLLEEKPSIRTEVVSIYVDGCRSPTSLLEVRTQLLAGAELALLPESDQHRDGMGIAHEPPDRRRGNRSRGGELESAYCAARG